MNISRIAPVALLTALFAFGAAPALAGGDAVASAQAGVTLTILPRVAVEHADDTHFCTTRNSAATLLQVVTEGGDRLPSCGEAARELTVQDARTLMVVPV